MQKLNSNFKREMDSGMDLFDKKMKGKPKVQKEEKPQ